MIKVASLFSQLLHHFPRTEFAQLVTKHQAERRAKGFTCWTQMVAMLFCHLAHADSLKEICGGLACCQGKLRHLGISKAPNKSTLSYANQHRPAELFEELFWTMTRRFRALGSLGNRKRKFRFKNKLLSLDSTTISLCLNLFPWAKFRRAKGGVKVHVLLDHDDYMPSFALITEAKRHDRSVARRFNLQPGSIVAFDRAYNDYTLFSQWTDNGIYFVTRLKDNAVYRIVENRSVPQNLTILADQIIQLTGHKAEDKCPHLLRRVVVWDEAHNRIISLLTNHLKFGATTISDIYKDRWEIEVFFKTLKQHLKIKTFIGTSENALRIQIWTALIALLLLKYLHHLSKFGWSMSNLATMLRLNLFTYRDLLKWLHDPFGQPPAPPLVQLRLPGFGQPIAV
ncbi:MAG: IS4 family transposase [Desulfobulbaceae bacterium]|nr:IS4 family transposase [Desulfobulbaceae bacterium]